MKRLAALLAPVLVLAAACSTGPDDESTPDGRATLVVLGDSLTAPIGRDDADWLQWADPEGRFELLANAGVPGERTDQILARVESDVIVPGPEWATVLAGTNDVNADVDAMTIIANLTAIYDQLAAAQIGIIALTLPPMVMLQPNRVEAHQAVNAWLREHVEVDWPGSVLADWNPALSVNGDGISPIPEYFADMVHLNAEGARAGGEALRDVFAAVPVD